MHSVFKNPLGTYVQIELVVHNGIWWVGERGGWEENGSECHSLFFSITRKESFLVQFVQSDLLHFCLAPKPQVWPEIYKPTQVFAVYCCI